MLQYIEYNEAECTRNMTAHTRLGGRNHEEWCFLTNQTLLTFFLFCWEFANAFLCVKFALVCSWLVVATEALSQCYRNMFGIYVTFPLTACRLFPNDIVIDAVEMWLRWQGSAVIYVLRANWHFGRSSKQWTCRLHFQIIQLLGHMKSQFG